jgi:predicted hydrocarbon binding protein
VPEARLVSFDHEAVSRIGERLLSMIVAHVLRDEPMPARPELGDKVHMHMLTALPALASEQYRIAMRIGGAMVGKRLGERLLSEGLSESQAIEAAIRFMQSSKTGQVSLGASLRIEENYESAGLSAGAPSCVFTSAFLNGLFAVVRRQHVREVKCAAAGDACCEWQIF